MTNNYVTVTAQWSDGTNYAQGNYLFIASGALMSSPAVAIVTPVKIGQLDTLGAFSESGAQPNTGVRLLASDNFGAGELNWTFRAHIKGIPDIHVEDFAINYTTGATQGLFGILEAAGWSAAVT